MTELVGLGGPWLTQQQMKSKNIQFYPMNIEEPFSLPRLFDLAITVEVAEHVRPESSDFFRSLTSLSDAVVFGAAFTGQPGKNHHNTRDHSFWCNKFLGDGYLIFDFFRPRVWGDPEIAPFYQQNTFLFVRPSHPLFTALISADERPMANPRFVDAVHPWLYHVHFKKG